MATINKDFRVKHGLVVEGTTATVNGEDILTTASTTSDLTEGTNLYFTDQRAIDAVAVEIGDQVTTAVDAITTDVIEEGTTNLYYTESRAKTDAAELLTGATLTNITITGDGAGLTITAENGGIQDLTGFDTDDLSEGTTNKYFTDQRAIDAIDGSATSANEPNTVVKRDGSGNFAATNITAGKFDTGQGELSNNSGAFIVRSNGSNDLLLQSPANKNIEFQAGGRVKISGENVATESYVGSEVDTHSDLTTGVHGVTGSVVGTTDTQDLSNKRIIDELTFSDGLTINNEAQIAVLPTSHDFEIKALEGDVLVVSTSGDVILDADGSSYLGSATAGNEIATKGYVDGLATNYEVAGAAATAEQNAKNYADGVVQGLDVKGSVRVASTGNVQNLTSVTAVDGVTLADEDRVLLKNQSTGTENGIYVFTLSTTTLTRAADQPLAFKGDYALVVEGTYAATGWLVSSVDELDGSNVWTQFSAANEYTASTGITITGNAISVTAETYDAYGAAGTAEQNAKDYADETFVTLDDLPGQLDDYVPVTDKGIANGIATLDANGFVPASQLDIDVSGDINDAIDAITTDVIEEGTSNLYFTNSRAVDALEAVVPNFTDVEINSLAKQVAATSSSLGSVPVAAYAFPKATYRTAKFLVKIDNGTHNDVTEVLLTLDSSDNIAITEYAIVGTNGTRGEISADISGANVRLVVNPVNDSTINIVGTLLA